MLMYLIAGIALIAALVGGYVKIHHDGYEQGVSEVRVQWDAAAQKAQKEAEDTRIRQDQLRQTQEKEATRRLADAQTRQKSLLASLEAHIRVAGAAAQCPLPLSLFDDWNSANRGPRESPSPGTVPPASPKPAPPS